MRYALLLWFIAGIVTVTTAQQEMLLHALHELPQAGSLNPAIAPKKEGWILSLPSVAFNYGNNAFTIDDLIRRHGADSLVYDIPRVLSKLEVQNVIQYQLNVDLLRVSWRKRNLFLSALVSEKVNTKFYYSDDLVHFAWYGNGAHIGDTVRLGPRLDAHYYRELSVSGGYVLGKFTVGIRAKFLAGLGNVETHVGQLDLYTDPVDYALTAVAKYEVQTAGLENFGEDPWRAAGNFRNPGIAADAGITYTPFPRLSFQASIGNVGTIWWSDDVKKYSVDGTYEFGGIALNNFFSVDTLTLKNLGDTLKATFLPREDSLSYASDLVPRGYIGVRWKAGSRTHVGVVVQGEYVGDIRPSFAATVGHRLFPFLELATSVAWKNRTWENVGLAVVFQWKQVQVYGISDNFVGAIQPRHSRNVNFRIGANVALGQGQKM